MPWGQALPVVHILGKQFFRASKAFLYIRTCHEAHAGNYLTFERVNEPCLLHTKQQTPTNKWKIITSIIIFKFGSANNVQPEHKLGNKTTPIYVHFPLNLKVVPVLYGRPFARLDSDWLVRLPSALGHIWHHVQLRCCLHHHEKQVSQQEWHKK